MRNSWIVVLATLCVTQVDAAETQPAETASSHQRQDILEYQLTLPRANALISALQSMTQYFLSLPDFQDRVTKSMHMTPAQQRAQMENDATAMAILKQNGLTAEEYVVGVPTLRMALMAAQNPSASQYVTASPSNVAFAKAHLVELKPKMDAADGVARPK
jgi:hypothetical protein